MTPLHLRRADPARNMRRFYRLDIQPDLFGRVMLLKQWGRVGTHGRMQAESFESEELALAALQRQAERKRRRGYMSSTSQPSAQKSLLSIAHEARDACAH